MVGEKRDFKLELINLLNLPDEANIMDIFNLISNKSINDPYLRNKIFQYLKKMAKQNSENFNKIYNFLNILKRSKFKTFKINIKNAFHSGFRFEGSMEIIMNGKIVLPMRHCKSIRIESFVNSISNDIVIENKLEPDEKNALIISGCGCYGCCPAFHYNTKHKNKEIIIYNVFSYGQAYEPDKHNKYLPGTFKILQSDYRSEILRLEQISKKCLEKTNKIPWKKPTKKFYWLQDLSEKLNARRKELKVNLTKKEKEAGCTYENILHLLKSSDKKKRSLGAFSIGDCQNGEISDLLSVALKDDEWGVRGNALIGLTKTKLKNDPKIIKLLEKCMKDRNETVRFFAESLLNNLKNKN